ncbi:MAG TPA: PEP-CTERM sorting domain-containing protein [Terriglobales bacterium]|nr:PEP-CTERM sorting domain-containing protein [Terriglobales bacterium]
MPLFSASSARADELYAFSFTTTGGPDFGLPIQSFSFSFTVPTFVVANNATLISTFTPFNITDGITTWTITQALAGNNTHDCFLFGSAGAILDGPGCGGSTPLNQVLMRFDPGLFLYPTATGTSSDSGSINFANGITFGTWSLVVSDVTRPTTVPEPSSLLLLASGAVGMLGLKRRYRKSA